MVEPINTTGVLQIQRIGRVNRMAAPVVVPRLMPIATDNFIGIGIGIHETTHGPALALTIAGPDVGNGKTTATALITPDKLGEFMALMTNSTSRLADQLIPGEGDKQ